VASQSDPINYVGKSKLGLYVLKRPENDHVMVKTFSRRFKEHNKFTCTDVSE